MKIVLNLVVLSMLIFIGIFIVAKAGNTIQAQRDCAKEYQLEGWTLHEAQQRCATRRDIWE
jgi:hypothetical protein